MYLSFWKYETVSHISFIISDNSIKTLDKKCNKSQINEISSVGNISVKVIRNDEAVKYRGPI